MYRSNRLNIVVLSFLSVFILFGCSYSSNVAKVAEEDLATYNPKHFAKPKKIEEERVENENDLIIQAIWYEMQGDFKKSNHFYSILYDQTNNVEYMFRELTTALYAGIDSKNVSKLEEWTKKHPDNIQSKRLLISFYINEKKNKKPRE